MPLTYAIGGVDIEWQKSLEMGTPDFVVGLEGNTASFYAGRCGSHTEVAKRFSLGTTDEKYKFIPTEGKRVIGGGWVKLERLDMDISGYPIVINGGDLFVGGFSNAFGSVPEDVAYAFGELLKLEIEKIGIRVRKVVAATDSDMLNQYWLETTA